MGPSRGKGHMNTLAGGEKSQEVRLQAQQAEILKWV